MRKEELRRNLGQCPWQNYPTHKRNKQLQCNGDLPLTYGYCSQDLGCPSCAGTLYKPNLLLEQGRPFLFIECPHCDPAAFRRRVEKWKDKLPRGAGPTTTPVTEKAAADAFDRRRADALERKAERSKRLK
jgi:hypothetical protein